MIDRRRWPSPTLPAPLSMSSSAQRTSRASLAATPGGRHRTVDEVSLLVGPACARLRVMPNEEVSVDAYRRCGGRRPRFRTC